MTLILNNQNVRDLLTMTDVIKVLEFAYKELAEGRAALRRRSDTIVTSDDVFDLLRVFPEKLKVESNKASLVGDDASKMS